MPRDLAAAIRRNRLALTGFTQTPPSHQRRYIEYIASAKRPATRAKYINHPGRGNDGEVADGPDPTDRAARVGPIDRPADLCATMGP